MGLNIAFAIPFSYVGSMATAASAALNALLLGIPHRERVLVAQPELVFHHPRSGCSGDGRGIMLTPSTSNGVKCQRLRGLAISANYWRVRGSFVVRC